jgi:hypothetical protein
LSCRPLDSAGQAMAPNKLSGIGGWLGSRGPSFSIERIVTCRIKRVWTNVWFKQWLPRVEWEGTRVLVHANASVLVLRWGFVLYSRLPDQLVGVLLLRDSRCHRLLLRTEVPVMYFCAVVLRTPTFWDFLGVEVHGA